MSKQYITAAEIAERVGVSKSLAYKIIRELNAELRENGYLVIAGRLPTAYFNEKWYGANGSDR